MEVLIVDGILFELRNYSLTCVLKQVYFGVVYPHLQYAITRWGKAQPTYENKVEIQQNRLIKLKTKNHKHETKLLSRYNQLSSMKSDQTINSKCLNLYTSF